MFILSISAPLLIGFILTVRALLKSGSISEWLLVFTLTPGTGIAISSAIFFIYFRFLRAGLSLRAYSILELLACLVLLASLIIWSQKGSKIFLKFKPRFVFSLKEQPAVWQAVLAYLVFLIFFANVLDEWHARTLLNPHGHWDAWAIWNLRAKFIFSTEYWENGFSDWVHWSHPDYPLLIPSFIAREWSFLGRISPAVPALLGLVFLLSVVFTLVMGVGIFNGLTSGVLAGMFALSVAQTSLNYLQYADLPLAFFFLAANLAFYLAGTKYQSDHRIFFLAGFFTGAALWTKNEGIIFVLVILISEVLFAFLTGLQFSNLKKRWLYIFLGCLPFLFVWILFNLSLAPSNDLIASSTLSGNLSRISDLGRMRLVGEHFLSLLFAPWSLRVPLVPLLLFYLLVVGIHPSQSRRHEMLLLGGRLLLMVSFYFSIYLLTPRPLDWHLESSADRLFLQLLPSLILMVFLGAKNPFRTIRSGE
jgi:hypothetical protein